jgi:hypothetical protein
MPKLSQPNPIQHFNDQIKAISDQAKAVQEHGKTMLAKWVVYASSDWQDKFDQVVAKLQKPLLTLDQTIDKMDASIERSLKKRKENDKIPKVDEVEVGRLINEGGAQKRPRQFGETSPF